MFIEHEWKTAGETTRAPLFSRATSERRYKKLQLHRASLAQRLSQTCFHDVQEGCGARQRYRPIRDGLDGATFGNARPCRMDSATIENNRANNWDDATFENTRLSSTL